MTLLPQNVFQGVLALILFDVSRVLDFSIVRIMLNLACVSCIPEEINSFNDGERSTRHRVKRLVSLNLDCVCLFVSMVLNGTSTQ